jgi:DNA-binding transcriptional LysR family regulator
VEQRQLFTDTLVLVAGHAHPLASKEKISVEELAFYPWIVGQTGTPIRRHLDALFDELGVRPASIIESSSLILMRELASGPITWGASPIYKLKRSRRAVCWSLCRSIVDIQLDQLALRFASIGCPQPLKSNS